MNKEIKEKLIKDLKIRADVLEIVEKAEDKITPAFKDVDEIAMYNQYKVLAAFQKNKVRDGHFAWNTGYGYDDIGRDVTEQVYADVFGCEAALVRPIIVNGTHAITLAIQSLLRPGDKMMYISGTPYDTIHETIGINGRADGKGTLRDFGISYDQVDLTDDGKFDIPAILAAIDEKTKLLCIQRSTGYAWRKGLEIADIENVCKAVKERYPGMIIFCDNCYGEFLDTREPTNVGVDIIAGSLIKNPGGGLALTGGYVAGRKDLIDLVSYRMTTPGIGGECGLTFGQTRAVLQGFFLAPNVAASAVKGAMLCAAVFSSLGYEVNPKVGDVRSDIIQSIKLGSEEAVVQFCKGVQSASPIDSYVSPEPWDMPGYNDKVVMAAGAFVQGSSIELSADAPMREPYIVYFQGGLTYAHSKFGVIKALQCLAENELIK